MSDPKVNGLAIKDAVASAALIMQGKALQEVMLRIGKPVEIVNENYLDDGEMYVVDTSRPTEFHVAEEEARVLIVHNGMLEEAQELKRAMDSILSDSEEL